MLDVARCPICESPMTPRLDRRGPYFHCLCRTRAEQAGSGPPPALAVKRLTAAAVVADPPRENDVPLVPFPTCNNNLSSVG